MTDAESDDAERSEPSRQSVVTGLLDAAIDRGEQHVALRVQRLRENHPEASPADLCALLERRYVAAVTGTGAATGAAAAVPGVGTGFAIAMGAGDLVTTLEETVRFALSVAEVHGIRIVDVERRRTLLLALLVGDSGPLVITEAAGRIGGHWGRTVVEVIPMTTIVKVNRVLGQYVVTKYGAKQAILVLGKAAPFGIGAGIGAGANALVAWSIVRGVRQAFGPAPTEPRSTAGGRSDEE